MSTPFGIVVERFLDGYVGRTAYDDFFNELHWFMGGTSSRADDAGEAKTKKTKRGKNRPNGGRFGIPCKSWPIYRINAQVIERYLRQRKKAGLSGNHAFIVLRTLMNWARKAGYIPTHDLDRVDHALRRRGRRRYIPPDADVVRVFNAATGKFKEVLLVHMLTGIRPKELRTVRIDEFDRVKRQWVLWHHKVVERTGMPKVVPLATDDLVQLCVANASDRDGDEPLFLNPAGRPWSLNALRLRWYRLRQQLGLDSRFTLYSLRHWYLTMAVEAKVDGEIVSELAGHADRSTLDFYKKIRNEPLHQALSGLSAHTPLVRPEIGTEYLKQAIRFAAECGAPVVNTDEGPKAPWTTEAEDFVLMRYTLKEAASVAEPRGIKIGLEPHQQYSKHPEGLERIFRLVDSPALGINFDTGNAYLCGHDPLTWLERVVDRLVHLHAKDIAVAHADRERGKVTGTPVGCACGDGVIDCRRVIALCRQAPRDIVLSVECGTVDQAERSLKHLQSLLK